MGVILTTYQKIGMILWVRAGGSLDVFLFLYGLIKYWTNSKTDKPVASCQHSSLQWLPRHFGTRRDFHFWITNWQISPGCDWKWHWTFKAMMVKLDFQGWEVLPMFRDLLAYSCTNSLRLSENLLAGSPEKQWRYLITTTTSKAETFWHLSQCQEINQWFTWNFLAMSKQAL